MCSLAANRKTWMTTDTSVSPATESLRHMRSPNRATLVACRLFGDVAEWLKAPACYVGNWGRSRNRGLATSAADLPGLG